MQPTLVKGACWLGWDEQAEITGPAAIRRALARRFPADREAQVRRADQAQRLDHHGKWGSAIGYITKERLPEAAWNVSQGKHDKHFRDGLPVLGKRYRITANLRAASVAKAVTNNPLVTPAMRRENRKATARPSRASEFSDAIKAVGPASKNRTK
jgi:hypothetical protein